ncbi:hypothetical protein DV736_g5145, partial [Chaetothyriales sp. CBS 134916]
MSAQAAASPPAVGATATTGQPVTNAAPQNQQPSHPSFRRQRASRACETCHARKVRCDAASLGVPCTNCVAFSIECRIPVPKRKRTALAKSKDEGSQASDEPPTPTTDPRLSQPASAKPTVPYNSADGLPQTQLSEAQAVQEALNNTTMAQFIKPRFARAPIKEAGRVAYLGESSNLSLLVHDRHGTTDVVHYPLPENIRGARARLTEPDQLEIEILQQRGAFLLPPRALCDELVDAYFRWVAPVVPVINRSRFMKRYRDPKNPPSLLLLQAVLLAGSRVCTNPQLMDANGSTTPAAMTFYKRAKALYDANYEDDRITIVQALILMGWYWEGPEDVTKNVFYWTRVAIVVAQGAGMHRSVENSQLSRQDKRLWKRVWWSLFTRDRSVAVALGRPVSINTDDSDVEMISEQDFIEDEGDAAADFRQDPVHVQFFLQYVKLCEIMGLVLSQQYSVASKTRRTNTIDLTHSDMALADWLQNCPREVYWERSRHHFWSALLHSNYYTTLCLLHRSHMPPATTRSPEHENVDMAYPSRTIAFQAAGMITSIVENLLQHDEVKYTPAFIVYSLFSALIMHVYQMRSSVASVVAASHERINVCMNALKEVAKVWLVAKMVHTLFESILGNKVLEERLQKATGRKVQRKAPALTATTPATKRKFDDIDLGFAIGPPAPQVSYERSRPQTPAETPRELQAPLNSNMLGSPTLPSDPLLSNARSLGPSRIPSRAPTRANSPFNGYSIPATPPDLFLVTRDEPNISQHLWENFQPDQLFPDGTIGGPDMVRSPTMHHTVDPQLQMGAGQAMADPAISHINLAQQQNSWSHGGPGLMANDMGLNAESDRWSNSSIGNAPIAPTTLNVEDWFQFFGINGASQTSYDNRQSHTHARPSAPAPAPSAPAHATSVGLTSDLWSAWSSYASSLLSGGPAAQARTKEGKSVPRPPKWMEQGRGFHIGPSVPTLGLGSNDMAKPVPGSLEDRRAMAQAERRKALLAASTDTPDARGNYKRRDSISQAAVWEDSDAQAQALVYRHRIQHDDTLAGVMLKYGCQPDVFRKVNRLWPNDSIQMRTQVLLPVDACAVRGKRADGPRRADLLGPAVDGRSPSPSRHSAAADDDAITHESWVLLPTCPNPVEIVRMPRSSLGYFPRARRKSNSTPTDASALVVSSPTHKASFDKLRHPPTHAAQVSMSLNASPIRRAGHPRQMSGRQRSSSSTTATSSFSDALRGPGGVGTLRGLRTEPSRPGPADDALNQTLRHLFPDLDLSPSQDLALPRLGGPAPATPRLSSDSVRSMCSNSSGLGEVSGALEGWVRKLASKKDRGSGAKMGDLIELETNSEQGEPVGNDDHLNEDNFPTPTATRPDLSRQWGLDPTSQGSSSARQEDDEALSIVTKAATGTPILTCFSQAIRPVLRQPLYFLVSRPFLLIFGLYFSTYSTANAIDTLTSTMSNQPADRVTSNTAKFVATSAVNMTASVYKDSQFARMFGLAATSSSSPAATIPKLTYALFAARDCLTIFASFNLPTIIAPKLLQLPASVQARFKPLLSTEAGRINTAQFVAPSAIQIFSTPIHLLGLDLYNRQAKLSVRARGARIMRDWGVSALARMGRIIPAFGVGGVFGAVLYLATIFPATLMPMSVYAVSRGLAAVLFSPLLGRFIDSADRLGVVRWSIG